MAKLIYSAITSLDGYIEDRDGSFGWAQPDEEVHTFINGLEQGMGTCLYGRRMYETMVAWETDPGLAASSAYAKEFAEIWQQADKIVFSKTLESASTERTSIERDFDAGAIRQLKAATAGDLSVAGPGLAAHAFEAGLVDECQLFLAPVLVGGGKQGLPAAGKQSLDLVESRSFGNGMVFIRYRVGSG